MSDLESIQAKLDEAYHRHVYWKTHSLNNQDDINDALARDLAGVWEIVCDMYEYLKEKKND